MPRRCRPPGFRWPEPVTLRGGRSGCRRTDGSRLGRCAGGSPASPVRA
ncbi:hypothetical protein P376_3456 [Streptomyces sp. HCCB10043]|nr:hypothetical protein P376_3456 [Streptomyces sp. HCCB10043]